MTCFVGIYGRPALSWTEVKEGWIHEGAERRCEGEWEEGERKRGFLSILFWEHTASTNINQVSLACLCGGGLPALGWTYGSKWTCKRQSKMSSVQSQLTRQYRWRKSQGASPRHALLLRKGGLLFSSDKPPTVIQCQGAGLRNTHAGNSE